MSAQTWQEVTWDVARSGGIMAYVLLTLSVALGLALSMRWQRPAWPRLITNELHNYLTLLSLIFIGVHGLAVWVDPFMRFSWRDVLVPLATAYRPLWMAAGIVGFYLILAVWISTQLRAHISYSLWRRLHTLTFGVYVLSTLHGLGTGTDTRQSWALELYAASVVLVGALLIYRLLTPSGARGRRYPRLALLSVLIVGAGALWAATGPARPGWSATANSVPGLAQQVIGTTTLQQARTGPDGPLTAGLQGTMTESGPDANGAATLRFAMSLNDNTGRTLGVSIQADAAGEVTASQVTLANAAGATLYQGPLTQLSSGLDWRMAARLTGVGSSTLDVTIVLRTAANGQVTGTVQGAPVSNGTQ